ncbi:MFS general substrate transporter [Xylaria sp. FL0043]|nr:MFS general substrate transporter [Xylaria sp. FL0043]
MPHEQEERAPSAPEKSAREGHDPSVGVAASPPSLELSRTDRHTFRFWGTFVALCLLAFISALDVAIITTALPDIIDSVGGGSQYVWIANSFVVASAVLQPLTGQLADALGRRGPIIASTALFALGSGIAGGAHTAAMLIAGRVVQGIGAGGINVLLDIICCDLVPLRERGKYLGLLFSWSGIAAALGPPVGGALAQVNWRWIFWINLPVCGLALVALLLFMRVKSGTPAVTVSEARDPRNGKGLASYNLTARLKRLDYFGNSLFTLSMISLLLGLVEGGTVHPWSSWRIILPLVLGIVGWIAFHIQQLFATQPSVPARLFANRTSATGYLLTFLSSVMVQALAYFLPIYFQAVKATTILESGVNFLPLAIGTLAFAVLAGVLLSYIGRYKLMHAISLGISALAFGLLTRLKDDTPTAEWAWYELIASLGSGLILSILLPAIMAGLPESDVATASSTYSFIRTFGWIWGVTSPGLIFNSVFDQHLDQITDLELRAQLSGGQAYSFASQVHGIRDRFTPEVWKQVTGVYIESLRAIWWFGLAISLLSFLAVGFEEELELRKELKTEYGLDESHRMTAGGNNISNDEEPDDQRPK